MKGSTSDHARLVQLRKRMEHVPTSPGMYQWLDEKGTVLYVGKAKNLRSRLRSYISLRGEKTVSPWKRALVDRIADFRITICSSELEALILEIQRIKELKPRFNVLMKDDKNYVYLRISAERYPSIDIVRQMEKDTAAYFGPFLQKYALEETLNLLHRLFRFRACNASINTLNRGKTLKKPCLASQIGECNGLCSGNLSQEDYNHRIEEVRTFFKGNHKTVLKKLQKMMQEAAEKKRFERAATIRNMMIHIEEHRDQIVSDTSRMDCDVIAIAQSRDRALAVVLHERGGKIVNDEVIPLQGSGESRTDLLTQFIPQFYDTRTLPKTILLQEGIPDEILLETLLKHTKILAPERGKKSRLLQMAEKNAMEQLRQELAKWEAAAQEKRSALEELQTTLHLPSLPKRIEGYDISHLAGTETVGSMVVMLNGKSKNDHYRSFTIRTMKKGEIDDYKALQEVLTRRLRHLMHRKLTWKKEGLFLKKKRKNGSYIVAIDPKQEEHYAEMGFRHVHKVPAALEKNVPSSSLVMVYDAVKNKPDVSLTKVPELLVIDGGKGQLSTVKNVLQQCQLDIPIIGLAKREEEVFTPDSSHPIIFPKDSSAKFLLMRLRDEAHRFANRHREKRLQRNLKESFTK